MWIRGISIAVLLPALLIAVQALPVQAERSVLTADPPPAPDPGLASEVESGADDGPSLGLELEEVAPENVRREARPNPIRSQPEEADEIEEIEPDRVESQYVPAPELGPSEYWEEPAGPGYAGAGPGYAGDCGGCASQCGSCAVCCNPCGQPHMLWVQPEYLLWWTKGMYIPPLVTTSVGLDPTEENRQFAGVLGLDTTEILYGNQDILEQDRHGFRIRSGIWLDPCRKIGLDGEYFFLGTATAAYEAFDNGAGIPILARPYFDVNPRDLDPPHDLEPPAEERSQLVAYPEYVTGTVRVDATSSLSSAAAHFRINVCCNNWNYRDPCNPCCCGYGNARLDFLVGYRWARLKEGLLISEFLDPLGDALPPPDVFDRFNTYNDFHACDLGVQWQVRHNRWFLETLGRISLGNNRQTVDIMGISIADDGQVAEGGLLALETNNGRYSQDQFTMIPEIGVKVGCDLTPCLTFTAGYSLLYWGSVVRPGEQIDRDVNPDYLPEVIDPVGARRPRFEFDAVDFWAQGLSLGLDYRW